MSFSVNKHTVLCISLAGHPGNFGNYFHNYLYRHFKLNYLYKSCCTDDLKSAIESIRALQIRGCGVSMPFKSDVLKYMDHLDLAVSEIGAANTIVNDNGILSAYNTDSYSLSSILSQKKIDPNSKVLIKGSGGMARAIVYSIKKHGIKNITINARNENDRAELVNKWNLDIITDQHLNEVHFDIIINATPLGMEHLRKECPFNENIVKKSTLVIDVVVNPNGTKLSRICDLYNIPLIRGEAITKLQAKKQFELYTGQLTENELVDEAYRNYELLASSN
jgi:shikimate dehydrogenase